MATLFTSWDPNTLRLTPLLFIPWHFCYLCSQQGSWSLRPTENFPLLAWIETCLHCFFCSSLNYLSKPYTRTVSRWKQPVTIATDPQTISSQTTLTPGGPLRSCVHSCFSLAKQAFQTFFSGPRIPILSLTCGRCLCSCFTEEIEALGWELPYFPPSAPVPILCSFFLTKRKCCPSSQRGHLSSSCPAFQPSQKRYVTNYPAFLSLICSPLFIVF